MIRLTHLLDRPLTAQESARALRLCLTYDERVKTRLATMSSDGRAVALLLADVRRGSVLRDGSVLGGDDGAIAVVVAAPQPVARITAASPLQLLRATYHLANRHVPAQLGADHLLIERDPVLEAMLRGLGVTVAPVEAPFDPEGGAYPGHDHAHAHANDHALDHTLDHAHAADAHARTHRAEIDPVSASVGEQLSIAAHARRRQGA